MLSARSNRASLAASAERMPSFAAMTLLTIVRLMRIISRSSPRRCLTALGMSRSLRGSRRTTKPRSAWVKIANRLSKSFGSTSFIAKALRKLWLISTRALSFAVVLPPKRKLETLDDRSSFDMTVELPLVSSSSINTAAVTLASSSRLTTGSCRSGSPWWKMSTRSQRPNWSCSRSSSLRISGRPLSIVPLRLLRSST